MIIKKKRLNKNNGLGDVPEEFVDDNFQNQVSDEDYVDELVPENSPYTDDLEENISSPVQENTTPDDIDIFNLDNIDFTQRQERRKGDRRRGFRRVDDRNLVSRAREEADAIRESAMKEGYQAGLQQAEEDLNELRSAVQQFMGAPEQVYEYIAPDILEISVDIAQKIIKKEIEQDPQVVFNTIVDVLKTLSREETKVTLQVNPAETNEVKQAVPELLNLAGINAKVIVLPDEEVMEGGCLVTTDNGVVDATIETRVNLVMEALREL